MCEKITLEKYSQIKKLCKKPSDDYRVMKKFKVSKSTAQKIRNTANYAEYQLRNKERGIRKSEAEARLNELCRNSKYNRRAYPYIKPEAKDNTIPLICLTVLGIFMAGALVFLTVKVCESNAYPTWIFR